MSVSVDDLVASFNSNHIGQEAIDLANLQVCRPLGTQAGAPLTGIMPGTASAGSAQPSIHQCAACPTSRICTLQHTPCTHAILEHVLGAQ